MRDIIYTDIQTCIKNGIDIKDILNNIKEIMKIEYPDYIDWFNNKVIPGIYTNERNIILIYKNNNLIGFVNLKKTKKERKLSNLYIKSKISYNKYFKDLINLSMNWLETDEPTLIISEKEFNKCAYSILNNNWNSTNIIKKNDSIYYIFNGNDEFYYIKKSLTKKRKKDIYKKENN